MTVLLPTHCYRRVSDFSIAYSPHSATGKSVTVLLPSDYSSATGESVTVLLPT